MKKNMDVSLLARSKLEGSSIFTVPVRNTQYHKPFTMLQLGFWLLFAFVAIMGTVVYWQFYIIDQVLNSITSAISPV